MDHIYPMKPQARPKAKNSKKSFFVPFNKSSSASEELKKEFDEAIADNKTKKKDLSFKDETYYFIIRLSDVYYTPAIYEELIKKKISIISVLDNKTLKVAVEKENLEKFTKIFAARNPFIIKIDPVTMLDKLSPTVKETVSDEKKRTESFKVFIELANPNLEKANQIISEINKFLSRNDSILYYSAGQKLSFITADLSPPTIKLLAEKLDAINRIEKRPDIQLSSSPSFTLMGFDGMQTTYQENMPTACMIDTGTDFNNPALSPYIEENYDALGGDGLDSFGHGSFVASRIIYANTIETKNPKASCKVISVKAFNGDRASDRSVHQIIDEAVKKYVNKTKVYNLSFGLESLDDGAESFKKYVDIIANRENVLFVVSAGNIGKELLEIELKYSKYPLYLPRHALLPPANCTNSLTVGSLTSIDTEIAPCNSISPFSKVNNPNQSYTKPEIFHFGGNISKDGTGRLVKAGVKGYSSDGKMVQDIGTSFANPIVANLAANLFHKYNGAPNHLIKAIIVNSSTTGKLYAEGALDKKWYGFGQPSFEGALGQLPNRVTYFCSTKIDPKSVHTYTIYAPTNANKVAITLCYNKNPEELESCDFDIKFRKSGVKSDPQRFRYPDSHRSENIKHIQHDYFRGGRGEWEITVEPKPKLYIHGKKEFDYSIVVSFVATDGTDIASEADRRLTS